MPNIILVTGGAGFIGSNIAAQLAARGDCDVVVCDRLGDAASGKWTNLAEATISDLITPSELSRYLDAARTRVRAVVHMGAISSTTEPDVDKIMDANFRLSADIWAWCSENRTQLIYASSAATYGRGDAGFVDDNDARALSALRPLNAYGFSKKFFDLYAVRAAARGEAPPAWSGLKFFNVYGPNEQHKGSQKSVVAHMHARAARGQSALLFRSHNAAYPDGGQMRDFIYVRDCVDVVEWLLSRAEGAGIVNVGTGKSRTFADLAAALFAALGQPPNVEFIDTPEEIRDRYQYFTEASMARLRGLGYESTFTSLEQGVAEYVRDYLGCDARP